MSQQPKLPSRLVNTLTSHTGPVNAIAFSSQGGTYILTGSSDRQIHLSRTEPPSNSNGRDANAGSGGGGGAIQKYAAHGYPVLDIAVAQDNRTFASVGGDRSVFLWDVASGGVGADGKGGTLRRLGSNTSHGHTSRINCVAFAGDGVVVSGGDDTTVRLWDLKSRDAKPLMVLDEAKDGISSVVVPENAGYEIVAGSVDGRLRSYDVRMGRVTADVMPGPVTSLDVSRDARTVLVGCLDGRIRMMDRTDGTCLRAFPPPPPPPPDPSEGNGNGNGNGEGMIPYYKNVSLRLKSCFAINESLVLSGSENDGRVRGWDVLSGKSVGSVDVNSSGKVVSVVRWREGSQAQGRQGLWAGGGAEGIVKIYS
ncbi:hypothetical protein LTR67_002133 [Exophiala xenobiotica]